MPAMRALAFASLAVGTSAIARAQPAPAPGPSAGSAAPGPFAWPSPHVEAPETSPRALDSPNLFAIGRTELELPLGRGFSLHAFRDVGGMADWRSSYALGQSAGAGIAWHSPIGTLSIDVAVPFGGGSLAVMVNFSRTF